MHRNRVSTEASTVPKATEHAEPTGRGPHTSADRQTAYGDVRLVFQLESKETIFSTRLKLLGLVLISEKSTAFKK